MKRTTIYDCGIIILLRNCMLQGNLTVVENNKDLPFNIKRVFILYDIEGGKHRDGHAHKKLWQLIVATCGSFMVTIDDGQQKRTFMLNRANQGLLIPPGIWCKLNDFSSGSICLILTSELFDESDDIRNYTDFIKYKTL